MAARIDQIKMTVGFPAAVQNVPPNYPDHPQPGKISLLFQANSHNLWHRFSPYTEGDNIFGIFPNKQPFVYRYPDEAQDSTFNRLPELAKTLVTATNVPRAIDDTVRVSKFLISPLGILYNVKQLAIQRIAPFDETRLYNPLSPILAAVQPATLGIGLHPIRHIEGGFVLGLLNSLTSTVGIDLSGGRFQTPSSTVGSAALPTSNTGQGKGLLRGGDANTALMSLNNKWTPQTGGFVGGLTSLFNSIKGTFLNFFGSSTKSSGTFRADEQTYDLMRVSKGKLDSIGKFKEIIPLSVKYFPGTIYKEDGSVQTVVPLHIKYTTDRKFLSNFEDGQNEKIQQVSDNLKAVIAGLKKNITYQTLTNTYSRLLSSGDLAAIGYDHLSQTVPNNRSTPKTQYGVIAEYASTFGGPKTVDKSTSTNNLRMATTFTSDALNRVGVIGKDRKFVASKEYPDYTEYKPYEDDLIAFFFYDVVNQKYIPFRATIKGISEGATAFWDELRFIGRADQLYSYNGFSRTLSFTFNVVISSLSELLPTWQKVNYIASAVKPSNYTTGEAVGDKFSRFIVPPMFMLTVGDLYKFQPMVITSVNVNIPDDAVWETLNELNSNEWMYLNGIIRSPFIGKNYAQLPKEAEIAITCNLLEKERSIVGGSHFGHAPRKDTFGTIITLPDGSIGTDTSFNEGGVDYLPSPTEFQKGMTTSSPIILPPLAFPLVPIK